LARLILFAVILIVAIVVWASKRAAGAVSGSERLKQETFRSQTQKTMQTTARGVNWLNEQWERANRAARGESDDPPFLALVIAVHIQDDEGQEQADRFFEEYRSQIDGMTRVDSSIDKSSGVKLARMCIDISTWSNQAVKETIKDLFLCIRDLERHGRAAFVVRCEHGQTEIVARNGHC